MSKRPIALIEAQRRYNEKFEHVLLRLTPQEVARVDKQRGKASRAAWIKAQILSAKRSR